MVFIAPSSPASTVSGTESGVMKVVIRLSLNSSLNSRHSDKIESKAARILAGFPGVASVRFDREKGTCTLVGSFDPCLVAGKLRKKIGPAEILSVPHPTAGNDTLPATERITELLPIEDTDLERKRSLRILITEEQQELSGKQQENQPPPQQSDSYIFQVKASLLARPLPSMCLPLASKARPSPSPVSPPSQGTSDQMQATPDHVSELSFPFEKSSSSIFWTESLADMPGLSSISGVACLPKDMEIMEEEGLGVHDQLYDSAVHHLLSGIDGIGELKMHYDLQAREQASRLREADDTAIILRKQVEELEAKLSMANVPERCLMDMVRVSKDGHARTKRELALMQEKLEEANCRINYLEAAVSRYQNRIAIAKIENEKAGERVYRASVEGGTMSTTSPSPAAPRSTCLSSVPLLLLVLFSQTWRCARKALFFLGVTSYLDNLE